MSTGKIIKWDPVRRVGAIRRANGAADLVFLNIASMKVGTRVTFDAVGRYAVNVQPAATRRSGKVNVVVIV